MVRLVVGPKRGMLHSWYSYKDDCGQRGQGIGLLDLEPKQSVRLGHSPAKAPDRPPLSGPTTHRSS